MRNSDSVENMQRNVMATYRHLISTDENPKHQNCPAGGDSWCKFRVAESRGILYTHPPPLDASVAKNMRLLRRFGDWHRNTSTAVVKSSKSPLGLPRGFSMKAIYLCYGLWRAWRSLLGRFAEKLRPGSTKSARGVKTAKANQSDSQHQTFENNNKLN